MMRILLVDDEPLALERLAVGMADTPDAQIVGTASDGIEALEKILALQPDLVILDIQMPALSGMEVAQALAEAHERPDLIFVTAFTRFAIEAFGVEATDYLLKPVCFDRLRIAVERVRRRRTLADAAHKAAALDAMAKQLRQQGAGATDGAYDDCIWVPGARGAVRVPVDIIDRIEAARDYSLLNTSTRSYILRAKMNELEQRLDPGKMMRIHRSHIVRLSAVVGVCRPGKGVLRLIMNDGASLQVGPNYQAKVALALGI